MTNFHLNGVRDFLNRIGNVVKDFATGVSTKKGGGTRSTKRKDRSEIKAKTLNPLTNSISKNLDSTQRIITTPPQEQTSLKNVLKPQEKNSSNHISKPSTSKIDLSNLTEEQIAYVKQLNVKEQQDWIDYYQEANNILTKLNDLPENAKQEITNLIHNFGNSEKYNLEKLKEFSNEIDVGTLSEDKLLQKAQEMFGNQTSQKPVEEMPSIPNAVTTSNTESTSNKNEKLVATIQNLASKRLAKHHRQPILEALNSQNEKINNETFKAIFDKGKCSSAVKAALLLSDKVSLSKKQEILKSHSAEIFAYAKDHKILNQVAYRAAGGIDLQDILNKGNELPRTEILKCALFDENGQFTLPDNIKNAKKFFNPTTFTPEERQEIVKFLTEKKIKNPQTDDAKINNLKIDMMIAQFQQDDKAMINATFEVANEMFNFVNNKIFDEKFNPLEPLQESQLSKLLDQTQSIVDIQNIFWKDLEPAKNDQQTKYNNCYGMLCGQLLTKESLVIRDLLNYVQGKDEQKTKQSLNELKKWNTTLADKQTMLNMLSKDNYENTLNRERLYMLKQGAESSFISAKWDEFDTNCKNGLNSFNLNIFITRYTDDQEQKNRDDLQNWLTTNAIQINVADYTLNQMDELAKAIEKEMKRRTNLKPYTSQ